MVLWLVRLFSCCFDSEIVPGEWYRACIVLLYKGKGDRCECSNSKVISLLSAVENCTREFQLIELERGRMAF